jgi:hypothetical protein
MEVIGYDDNTHKQTLDHSSEAVCYILLLNFVFFCVGEGGICLYIFYNSNFKQGWSTIPPISIKCWYNGHQS